LRNVPFTSPVNCGGRKCTVQLDVYVPAGAGPFPQIVLIRGGPGGLGKRAGLDSYARLLSGKGFLVYNADYRDEASQGGGYPAAFEDVACAIRFARATTIAYDGDDRGVTLVGHSLGGWVGSVVALDADEFRGGCLAGGSGRPNAFVGLSGNYVLTAPEVAGDLRIFFGGGPSATAAARTASNPFRYATGKPIPVRLIAGTADYTVKPSAARSLFAFLQEKGWNATLKLLPGAGHTDMLWMAEAGESSIDAIADVTSRLRVDVP
jgi:dipeptidyl aminopeptidase/acylaminoacyl peptidase